MGRRGRRRGAEGRDHTLPTLRSHGQVGIPRFPHPEPSVARSSHSGRDRCSLRQLRQWRKVRRRRSSGRCPRSYCETPSDYCRRSARRFSGTSSRRWRRSRIGGFFGGRKEAGERAQFRLLFLLVTRAIQFISLLLFVALFPRFHADPVHRHSRGSGTVAAGVTCAIGVDFGQRAAEQRRRRDFGQTPHPRGSPFLRGKPHECPFPAGFTVGVIETVSERIAGMCPGYFGVGDKLFNQGRVAAERILGVPTPQQDRVALQVEIGGILDVARAGRSGAGVSLLRAYGGGAAYRRDFRHAASPRDVRVLHRAGVTCRGGVTSGRKGGYFGRRTRSRRRARWRRRKRAYFGALSRRSRGCCSAPTGVSRETQRHVPAKFGAIWSWWCSRGRKSSVFRHSSCYWTPSISTSFSP